MPVYKCPVCGRTIEKPNGLYYCSKCGPSAVMLSLLTTAEAQPTTNKIVSVGLIQETKDLINRAILLASPTIEKYAREFGVSVPYIDVVETIKVGKYFPLAMYNAPTKTIRISVSATRSLLASLMAQRGVYAPLLVNDTLIYTILHEFYHHVQNETSVLKKLNKVLKTGTAEEFARELALYELKAVSFARDAVRNLGIQFSSIKYIVEKIGTPIEAYKYLL